MKNKFMKNVLCGALLLSTPVVTLAAPYSVLAQEEMMEAEFETEGVLSFEEMKEIIPGLTEDEYNMAAELLNMEEAAEGQARAAAGDMPDTDPDFQDFIVDNGRKGTDIKTKLMLGETVNNVVTENHVFNPGEDIIDVRIGGSMEMRYIWSNYQVFKTMYVMKNGVTKFRNKALVGFFDYEFQINTNVVSVNEEILTDTAKWQEAFATQTEDGDVFFQFMRCSKVKYDPITGIVKVRFVINEKDVNGNDTNQVKVPTLEDNPTAMPKQIKAYSPEGALTIERKDYKDEAIALPSGAKFSGKMDLADWMALVMPLRFQGEAMHNPLNLSIPDAPVKFNIENGTWHDGSVEPITVSVDTAMAEIDGEWHAAGTLEDHHLPYGMVAAEGMDPESGTWKTPLNMEENGVILKADDEPVTEYTFTFEPHKEDDDNKPGGDDKPGDDNNKPGGDDKPGVDIGGDDKPGDDNKPGNKPDEKPEPDVKPEEIKAVPVYRLYNPNSGEHFFTLAEEERNHLVKAGWNDEGIDWHAPENTDQPVYRLYNPNAGDHHFTMNKEEKDILSEIGWKYEGISWYSMPVGTGVEVHRAYNPNAKAAGAHHYTKDVKEHNHLTSVGWLGEGIAWYAVK